MFKKILSLGAACVLGACVLCGCGSSQGEILKLKDAYEAGWLTQEDLKSIAYYYNGSSDDMEFVPAPKKPETLSKKTAELMKKAYRTQITSIKDLPLEEIHVNKYCGTYHGCVVAEVAIYCYGGDILIEDIEIGGIIFYDYYTLSVWRNGS